MPTNLQGWQDDGYEEDTDIPMPEIVYSRDGATISKSNAKKKVFVTYEN
jgi:hypothetical protein